MGNDGDVNVVVCGEALVDFVPAGGNELYVPKLGGGPFNVAVTLGRLGSRVAFLGRVSTDSFGDLLAQRLGESGVDLSLLQRGPEPTTLALATLDATGAAQYTFYAGGTADRLVHDPGELPETVSALSFGTLSLLYEPGATVYENLLRRTHEAGKLIMLDPNIRPDAIADPAAYRARFSRWLPFVDILKVSDDDALWLADGAAVGSEQWLAAGVGAVLLTRGADGLSVLTRAFRVDVAAVQVRVSDTIGAGDTVHGALLNWLDRQGSLQREVVANYSAEQWSQALSYASRAAGITISRPGADPPWAREIEGD